MHMSYVVTVYTGMEVKGTKLSLQMRTTSTTQGMCQALLVELHTD